MASLLAFLAAPVQAQVAAGYSEFYIPGGENEMSLALRALGNTPAALNMHATIAITAWSDNTKIYYDHWENGITFDPENPAATADETFTLATKGTLLTLDNTPAGGMTIPRNSANTYYDGGDRIYVAGGAVTVTRMSYREARGRAVQAVAWEIYPVKPQLTTYILPFGENLSGSFADFLRTYVLIQATANDTTFTVDLDGNGTADKLDQNFDGDTADAGDTSIVTLQAGQSFFIGNVTLAQATAAGALPRGARATINSGAIIQGSSTLQVKFVIGDQNATYETRGLSAFPRGYWTKDYYAPVGGTAAAGNFNDIFLYNPNETATISIDWASQSASGTFTIGPKTTASFLAKTGSTDLPTTGGVYLKGSDVFWGVSTIDSTGQANEWAYSLLPSTLLYEEHFLGWASDGAAADGGDDSGVFLTVAQDNTTVFVDTDNDGAANQTYTLNRLQTRYITDPVDYDLSGSHFWATGPFTMSYGQNPDTAGGTAASGDLGYVAIPGTDFISLVLTVDKSASPRVVPIAAGSQADFTLRVNSHKYTVDTVSVVDTLPPSWRYVAGSAKVTRPDQVEYTGVNPTITGSGTAVAPYVLTWSSAQTGGNMAENQEILVAFKAETTAVLTDGTLSRNRVVAAGTRTVGGQTQNFNASDFVYVASGSLGITKTSTAPDPAYPGDQFGYTVTVTNPPAGATQTGVSLYDAIPAGLSYVPASGSVTCGLPGNYRDQFDTQAYNNTYGTRVWSATPWTETDSEGGGAASGLALITGGVLRLGLAETFLDQFGSASYALTAGTRDWSGSPWTETDGQGGGAASGLALVTGGVLRLGYAENVRDEFGTQAYTNNGPNNTANWATNWTETNDDNSASTTGDRHIYINTGGTSTLYFDRARTASGAGGVNMGISRTVNVAGVTAATISFTATDNGFDAGEAVVARYYTTIGGVESGPYLLGTYDGGTVGWSGVAQSFPLPNGVAQPLPPNTDSIRLEFISSGDWSANGDEMSIDNVDITYRRTPTAVQRSADLSGAASATLTFTLAFANLEAGDTFVLEASGNGGTSWGTLDSYTSASAAGAKSYNLKAPTDYTSANTVLRFRVTGGFDQTNETFSVDDVSILHTRAPATAVQRPANLAGASSATLTFTLAFANLEAGDTFLLEASSNGGTSWGTVDSYTSASSAGAKNYNLKTPTDYTSANTVIRFRVTGGFDQTNETFSAENLDISGVGPTTFASASPPAFLGSSAGCQIPAGGTLTLTYNVTVDNPLASGPTAVTNTAAVTTATYPIQLTASVTDQLANPSALSAAVAGRVFFDGVIYGSEELGEPGIANVEVTLKDRFGTPVARTYTDTRNGGYSFTGIAPGNGYYVEVTDGLPAGVTQTFPAGHTDNRTDSFNLAAGQERAGVDLGYRLPTGTAVFGDLAWVDADGDNVHDAGEVGLRGVAVQVWRDVATTSGAADGILDSECTAPVTVPDDCDTLVPGATVTTAPDGSYLVTGLAATGTETYFVLAAGPAGYVSTGPAGHRFFNTAAGTYLTADFGFQADGVTVNTYSISDRVWLDAGVLGTFDAGESGIAGVTIELLDASRNVIGTTTTAADGTFSFTGVAGGGADYTLRINDTANALADTFGTSSHALARERTITNLTASVDRRNDDVDPGLDPSFGFAVSRSIGDTVFNDSSGGAGDGVQQAGEFGIAGVVVKLYRDNGASAGLLDGTDTLVGTVTTDANGRYLFSGLANADYIVSVTAPAGYNYVGVLKPDPDPAAGTQRTSTIAGGNSDLTADFGFRAPIQRTVSGTLWEDGDANGAIGTGETARLAGLTIEIVVGTTVVASTTTDGSGNYFVGGLAPGSYTVRVQDPGGILTGYSATIPATGGRTADLTLANINDANFGFRKPPATRVFLAGFRATARPQGVLVEWETTAEIGTVGYRIVRVEGGAEVPVNERIVPAFIESRSGGRYALADPGATGSQLTYLLLEVRRTGEPVPYGPFTVTPAPAGAPARTALAASPALADGRASARVSLALPDGKAYAREPRRRKPAPSRQTAALDLPVPQLVAFGSKVRIAVTRDGLCRLFATEIAGHLGREASEIVTRINEGSLRLSNRGVQVAYLPGDNGASLVFHGTKLDTNFTGENVYWLEVGAGRKMRWAPARAARPSAKAQHFPVRLHGEEQAWPDFQLATDPEADYWLWKFLVAGDGEFDTVVLPLDAPSPAGAGVQATLTVRLVGGNDSPANPDHHVKIRLNGAQIGEASWNGLATIDVPCTFDQGLLTGSDQIEVVALLDPGVPESFVYVDSFDLDYRRRFVAVDNRLLLTGGGNAAVTVSGFTSRAILLFDLTSPNRPKLLIGATVTGSEGNYSVSFTPASPANRYLAAARSAIGLPAAVAPWSSTGLADPANAAEYLVVTAAPLLEAAGALAARREAQGLSTRVVTVSEIMDEFNAGIYDPAAIRGFLATAHETWAVPPRYVVLAGDGNYDYRNFLLYGPPVVPPAFVPTPYGLAAADGWYADADGDHVPEAAVGRLPAASNAELLGLVEKIAAFEDAAPGAWDTALLFAADNQDYAGDYPGDSGALIDDLPAGLATTTDYVGATTISAARTLFTDTVNAGVAHVSYFGHGGFDILADEGLVRLANEVPSLANGEMLPLFTLFTCAAGDFTDPYLVNLGEGLLLREGGGASAVLAPAGSAVHESSARLAREFFALRYGGGGGPRLGDAIAGAMRAYQFTYGGDFTLDVYNLLGDPGLRLR